MATNWNTEIAEFEAKVNESDFSEQMQGALTNLKQGLTYGLNGAELDEFMKMMFETANRQLNEFST